MLKYAIQCDRLRKDHEGDLVWHTMMKCAERIYLAEFLDECNPEDPHFEGESPRQVFDEMSDVAFYRVIWMGEPVYFYQTAGFEFFFTVNGDVPAYAESIPMHHAEFMRYGTADRGLLMPANSPLLNNSFGFETRAMVISNNLEIIQSGIGDERMRVLDRGVPVAGLKIAGNLIVEAQIADYAEHSPVLMIAKAQIEEFLQDAVHFSEAVPSSIKNKFEANLTEKENKTSIEPSFDF